MMRKWAIDTENSLPAKPKKMSVKTESSERIICMKRSHLEAMRRFEEALIAMSALAGKTDREAWMGTPKDDRDACLKELSSLAGAWMSSPDDLLKLKRLAKDCIDNYAEGELDAGDFAVKDIVEFLYEVRDQGKKPAAGSS